MLITKSKHFWMYTEMNCLTFMQSITSSRSLLYNDPYSRIIVM
uniref:Uncharacterized protein n=1 Tax=Arundo donax TaxID=35708 RepID=A0A0A9EZK6_ARUDO